MELQLLVDAGDVKPGKIAQAIGPLGLNPSAVAAELTKATAAFSGLQIPVKLIIAEDKSFQIEVGKPPVSQLLKKEAGLDKGSGAAGSEAVANLKIEQIIKVALAGKASGNDFAKVKQVLGTCQAMGILVEGMQGKELAEQIEKGAFKEKILSRKTELTQAELAQLEQQKAALAAEIEKKKTQAMARAKQIIDEMAGKPRQAIKARLLEEKIPISLINELLPVKAAEAGAAKT